MACQFAFDYLLKKGCNMGNTIQPANMGISNVAFHKVAAKNAVHTGTIQDKGKQETKTNLPGDAMEGIKNFERFPNGLTKTVFEDDSYQVAAPNGSTRDVSSEGDVSMTLPNGMTIEHGEDGAKVYNPASGQYSAAGVQDKDGQLDYKFQDEEGNKWSVNYNDLSFSVQNKSETLTQNVGTDGGIKVDTKTLSRDPVKGRFSQDTVSVNIDSDGNTTAQAKNGASDVAVNNQGITFNARDDLTIHLKFPYGVPQKMSGDSVKEELPQATPQPPMPPTMSGQDSFIPGAIGQDPWNPQQGITGPPGMSPTPDPFASQMTPSGLMRKTEPNGAKFISLPNGIVMSQFPDGRCEAFDARSLEGGPIPVNAKQVNNPQHGPETRYEFKDSVGNGWTVYSKSPDFAVSSPDGNVMQTVDYNGNMLINARTYPPDQNGSPRPKTHHMLLSAGGQLNTYGEKGVQLGRKNVVFAENGKITNYPLPYEVPVEQNWMPYTPPMGYMPPGNIPVPDPNVPISQVPSGQEMPSGQQVSAETEPTFPPGPQADPAQSQEQSSQAPPPPPAQEPVKPGIWQRVKNFFNGDETNKTPSSNYNNYYNGCCNKGYCNQYPGGYYSPNNGMSMGKAALIGAGVGLGTMALSSMMWPMGMYCSPFMGCGCMPMGMGMGPAMGFAGANLFLGLTGLGAFF